MGQFQDLTGQLFTRLYVLGRAKNFGDDSVKIRKAAEYLERHHVE